MLLGEPGKLVPMRKSFSSHKLSVQIEIVKFSYGKLVCMRARDVTLNKSELQRGCENANKMCDGDANCIRKDFKSTDSDSLESSFNQNKF